MPVKDYKTVLAGVALATVFGCGTALADCKPAHKIESTVNPGKLTVTIYEYPPFGVTTNGVVGGVDGEILKAVAATECLEFNALVVDPAATIQYVLAGKSDIAAGDWYRTAARAKVLGLSAPTYLDQMGIYSKAGYSTVQSMVGKKVGTVSGFLWVSELQKLLGSDLRLYPNPVALAQDLETGRVEIGVDGYATGAYGQKKGAYSGIIIKVSEPDERVQSSIQAVQSGFPYTKSNTSLGAALDADIEEMHKNGKIAGFLTSFGLDPSGANTGAPRVVK